MAQGREQRTFTARVELRSSGGSTKIRGYAAVFNEESQPLGDFVEVIRPGFFAPALETSDVRALWNHNDDLVLGRSKSGTLKLWEDDRGLRIEIDPPDTQAGRDAVTSIRRGDVDQMSFAFKVAKNGDRWTERKGKLPLRELIRARDIYDVSPVTYPAYEATEVSAEARKHLQRLKAQSGSLAAMRRRLEAAERGVVTRAGGTIRQTWPTADELARMHPDQAQRYRRMMIAGRR